MKTFKAYETEARETLKGKVCGSTYCDVRINTFRAIRDLIKADAEREKIPWMQEKALLDKAFSKYCQ